jgi:hypothetical protein
MFLARTVVRPSVTTEFVMTTPRKPLICTRPSGETLHLRLRRDLLIFAPNNLSHGSDFRDSAS